MHLYSIVQVKITCLNFTNFSWLSLPLITVQYVMYFRFFVWMTSCFDMMGQMGQNQAWCNVMLILSHDGTSRTSDNIIFSQVRQMVASGVKFLCVIAGFFSGVGEVWTQRWCKRFDGLSYVLFVHAKTSDKWQLQQEGQDAGASVIETWPSSSSCDLTDLQSTIMLMDYIWTAAILVTGMYLGLWDSSVEAKARTLQGQSYRI